MYTQPEIDPLKGALFYTNSAAMAGYVFLLRDLEDSTHGYIIV